MYNYNVVNGSSEHNILKRFAKMVGLLKLFCSPNTTIQKRPTDSYEAYASWADYVRGIAATVESRALSMLYKLREDNPTSTATGSASKKRKTGKDTSVSTVAKKTRKTTFSTKFEGMYRRMVKVAKHHREYFPSPCNVVDCCTPPSYLLPQLLAIQENEDVDSEESD